MTPKPLFFCLLLTFSISNTNIAKAQFNVQDSLALVDLYNSTDGPNWFNNTNWLKGPVATWYGVYAVGGGELPRYIIKLNSNNLNGNIPSSIGNLVILLGTLDLSDNHLSGNIPSSIGNLVNLLGTLDLSNNQLSGSIPSSLGNLVNLRQNLKLSGNQLTGVIPSSLGNLILLKYRFDISGNQLTGSIPESLGNFINLSHHFNLSGNQLSGAIPASLGNLIKLLGTFDLSYNQLTGSIPESLGNLIPHRSFNLSHNQLSGSIPSSLGKFAYIEVFDLSNNQLTGSIPTELENLNATWLYLNNNQLSGSIPPKLAYYGGWRKEPLTLNLSHNQLTGSIPEELMGGGNLYIGYLDLSYNNLSGNIPFARSAWQKTIQVLHLNNNQFSGNIPSSIGSKRSNLDELWLQNNMLSGKIPASLTDIPNKDCQINLSDNYFTFDGMERIAASFPNAEYAPQANIAVHQFSSSLYVSAGGRTNNNTYHWFRVGKADPTIITGNLLFHPPETGEYYVKVNNAIATDLTLASDTVTYTLLVTATDSVAYPGNTLHLTNQSNLFSVYPNPVKNILNIRVNGSASLSLLSQQGKTILTKTINNNSSIDVSHLAAGLYYLKNNSTSAVQKVIVVK